MTAVATKVAVEWWMAPPVSLRSQQVLAAMAAAAPSAGVDFVRTTEYQGAASTLMIWGPGAPNRIKAMRAHRAAGGRVVAFDLGYWNRDTKNRVSIDAAHPQAWVMKKTRSGARLAGDRLTIAERWNPQGPVVIAGIGQKAQVQYGDQVRAWEQSIADQCRALGRTVWYRPKQAQAPILDGCQRAPVAPIDDVLAGASLVCTWHSNVAVDAIRLGIPVACRDGAAAAVCYSELVQHPEPLPPSVRDQFLANLAHFQYSPSEAAACWAFLLDLLS